MVLGTKANCWISGLKANFCRLAGVPKLNFWELVKREFDRVDVIGHLTAPKNRVLNNVVG